MGFAMGVVGLRFDDFCNLEQDELTAICDSWNEVYEHKTRDEWERMRMLATISIQPHVRKHMTPKDLLPFPWEEEKKKAVIQPKEEARKRFEEVVKRLNQ